MESLTHNFEEFSDRIAFSLRGDRARLSRSLNSIQLRAKQGKPFDKSLTKFTEELDKSVQVRAARAGDIPKIEYDAELPIVTRKDDIAAAIIKHQVIVVCGETGSGKSTQLPKICLELGRGIDGIIGHTQPRRIAARSVAARVAEELKTSLGHEVGFKIRFTDNTRPQTYIKLMTDGILLAETQSDPSLAQYDTIIIDEAHERSMNIDFLMGYLKRILPTRPDLRVIITSATIDAQRFAAFFGTDVEPAPVLEVSGRTYPVELRYRPPLVEEGDEVDWLRATADACDELTAEGPGDILIFMPTERDIRETARILKGHKFPGPPTEILPLFGRLSEKEQNQVFKDHSGRRIVIATNVAESSLTVPGIKYVIDPGTARISRFSATSKVQRLPIEPISQASANQRMGRCGRVAPGICVRLYSAEDFRSREEYTQPEILRTNLASVLLQMKALHLGQLEDFPFLDSPNPTSIRSALKTLFELGAINENEDLTELGKSMFKLPVDPRIARMILAAEDEQCLEEVLIIASALEQRDPRERPLDKQQAADEAHRQFNHETSDFLSLLKLWDFYSEQEKKLSNSKIRKACLQNFLSYNRMREWKDLHRQLREIVLERGLKATPRRNNEDAIHRAILTGLLSNVAMKTESNEFVGSGGQKLFLWPGSVAFANKPKWIMGAELVETTRRFARCVAPVNPQWIENCAQHLVSKTYSEPHWSEKSAAVMAFEKVLLFGLPIVPHRQCRYGHVDPKMCRELFIQHALVLREYESPGEFFRHNARLKQELKEWQAKLRQGIHFVGEDAEFTFYDRRIPAHVFDGPRFEKWRKQIEIDEPKLLFQSREDLFVDSSSAPEQKHFPDHLWVGNHKFPVEYHLEPGAVEDGVTILVPPEGLRLLSSDNLSWLVPGLVEEKIAALIKTLPKQLRILFVPAPKTAQEVVAHLTFGQGDLIPQICQQLRRISGEHVPPNAFTPERLPAHLQFHVKVINEKGEELASGRDLYKLRQEISGVTSQTAQLTTHPDWHRDGLVKWTFGNLPQQITINIDGKTVTVYPMLIDQQQSVALRLALSNSEAELQTRKAMVRLFFLDNPAQVTEQIRNFPKIQKLTQQASLFPDAKVFPQHLAWRLAETAFFPKNEFPRNQKQWDLQLRQASNRLPLVSQELGSLLKAIFDDAAELQRLFTLPHPETLNPIKRDLQEQFKALFAASFLINTPLPWLNQFPRYLNSMLTRWKQARSGELKTVQQQKIAPLWQRWQDAQKHQTTTNPNSPFQHYHWLLEEFRVQTFTPNLKTAVAVSEDRLNELWKSLSLR